MNSGAYEPVDEPLQLAVLQALADKLKGTIEFFQESNRRLPTDNKAFQHQATLKVRKDRQPFKGCVQ